MRCLQLVIVVCLVAMSAVWAAGTPPVLQYPADQAPVAASLPRARQQRARHRAEVEQLQQDVARQNSNSSQADARLQQQDRTIAELQQQL